MALRVLILFAGAAEVTAGAAVGVDADVGEAAEGGLVLSLDGTVVAAVSILIAELLTLTSAEASSAAAALTSVGAGLTSGWSSGLAFGSDPSAGGSPEIGLLTEGVGALALALVLTFLAAAEVLLGGTVCRVGVICRDEGGRVGRAAPGVEGVGVCWRPERRDTSCSAGSDDVLVVVVEPVVESVTIAVVAVLVVVEPVDVAEAVDGVEEVAEAGVSGVTPGAAAEVVFGVPDSGLIAVGDVELLRDVLPFPRALSTFKAFLVTTTDTLLPAKAAICSSSFLPTTFAFTALAPFAVLALAGVLALFAPVCFLVVGFEAEDAPLSTERRLISDLSDLVEESVSLLLLSLLLDSTISWPT